REPVRPQRSLKAKRTCKMRDAILTRDNPVELTHRDALPRPRTFDEDQRTIEAVIASATPVRRRDQRGDFFEVLDPAGLDLEVSRGASVLNAHQQAGIENVIGTLDDVWLDRDQVIGRIRVSDRDEVAPLRTDIPSGALRH